MPRKAQPTTRKPFEIEQALRDTAEKLTAARDSIELNGNGEHDSTIENLCRTSAALIACCGELRQHEKARTRQLESYPISDLVARLKQLSDEERKDVARDISGETEEESLL